MAWATRDGWGHRHIQEEWDLFLNLTLPRCRADRGVDDKIIGLAMKRLVPVTR